jgi:hypothetical protein
MSEFEGTSEAIILVKASPQAGKRHGETVCCAGVNDKGEWVRLVSGQLPDPRSGESVPTLGPHSLPLEKASGGPTSEKLARRSRSSAN